MKQRVMGSDTMPASPGWEALHYDAEEDKQERHDIIAWRLTGRFDDSEPVLTVPVFLDEGFWALVNPKGVIRALSTLNGELFPTFQTVEEWRAEIDAHINAWDRTEAA